MERHLRGVNLVVGTIIYSSVNAKYRESSKDTSLGSLFDTLADCRDVLLRNSTADYGRLELEQLLSVSVHRLKLNFTVSVLSASTRLLSILVLLINSLCKGLLVSNLRCAYVSLYVELTKQTVYNDLQVKLTHTGNNCLSCLMICVSAEGRILLSKLC